MLRRIVGTSLILFGMVVLGIGFYSPVHRNIHSIRLYVSSWVLHSTSTISNYPWAAPLFKLLGPNDTGSWAPAVVSGCVNREFCRELCTDTQWSLEEEALRQEKIGDYDDELAAVALLDQGQLNIAGSSTLFKLTHHLAQCYVYEASERHTASNVLIAIASSGTTGDLDHFCSGREDLRDASESISVAQFEAKCGASYANVADQILQFHVARDAITIAVSQDHPGAQADTLSFHQLEETLASAERWSQVDPTWQRAPILRYYPGLSSGTLTVFAQKIFDGNTEKLQLASNMRPHENDEWAASQIANNPNAVGYFGFAYFYDYRDMLVSLPVDGVKPEQIWEGEQYPLERPLYLYTTKDRLCQNPLLTSYLRYYLLSTAAYVGALGYFPIDSQTSQEHEIIHSVAGFEATLDVIRQERGANCDEL